MPGPNSVTFHRVLATRPEKVYRAFLDAQALAGMERMGEKSAQNVMDSIARSREMELGRFIFALGIRQQRVGADTALFEYGAHNSLAL